MKRDARTGEVHPLRHRLEVVDRLACLDFDHTGDEWVADPYPVIGDLRERCPVAHTERYGGGWLPTRHEDVAAIAYDTERFSSRSVVMSNARPPR